MSEERWPIFFFDVSFDLLFIFEEEPFSLRLLRDLLGDDEELEPPPEGPFSGASEAICK